MLPPVGGPKVRIRLPPAASHVRTRRRHRHSGAGGLDELNQNAAAGGFDNPAAVLGDFPCSSRPGNPFFNWSWLSSLTEIRCSTQRSAPVLSGSAIGICVSSDEDCTAFTGCATDDVRTSLHRIRHPPVSLRESGPGQRANIRPPAQATHIAPKKPARMSPIRRQVERSIAANASAFDCPALRKKSFGGRAAGTYPNIRARYHQHPWPLPSRLRCHP